MVLRLEGKSSTLQRSSKVGPDFGHENHGPHFVVHTRMCVCVCVCVCVQLVPCVMLVCVQLVPCLMLLYVQLVPCSCLMLLCICSWYHGSISRRNAEQLLRMCREGSYLVRTSESNKLDYSLSVR